MFDDVLTYDLTGCRCVGQECRCTGITARVNAPAVAAKIATLQMAERTARRYTTALLDSVPTPGIQLETIFTTARGAGWHSPDCSYVVFPESMRGWPEARVIEWVKLRRTSVADARTVFGSYLVANEDLIPSSQRLQERIADLMSAARVAGWRPPEEETQTMPVPLEDRREQLARQYSKTHNVPIERGRMAVLAGHDAPPAPVDALSHEVEARAKAYAKQHGVEFNVALEKVFAADPGLAEAYVKPPVYPSAYAEQTAEQLVGKMTKAELTELLVTRKVGLTDHVSKTWSYEWLCGPGGEEYGTQAAADAHNAWWEKIQLERFRRFGLSQDTQR